MSDLAEIIDTFKSVDVETRLMLLLDFAKNLPALPERFVKARDEGFGRVPECMTPVFLFLDQQDGRVHIHADVAEEAPTVKGFVAILVSAFDGSPRDAIAGCPNDLLDQLGLSSVIRMNRVVGLNAVLARIKRETAALS